MKPVPYGRQDIDDDDIRAVVDVLRSDRITQGPAIERFEQSIGSYCNAAHAVAVNSATSALHLACRALGLGPGDILWTSPNTFVASANCALYCGASVDFVDIDPRTYNISIAALEAKLNDAQRTNRLPKIFVPVHYAGQSCDMRGVAELANRFGFKVVEDASHAIGAEYRGRKVGSCQYSDITVFSFHPVKIITTGEGGMLTTNRADIYRTLVSLRSHGITRESNEFVGEERGGWYYEQSELGYNYRITDIQAALGTSQLRRLDTFVRRRRQLAQRYDAELANTPFIRPWQDPNGSSAYHLYPVRVDERRTGNTRRVVYDALNDAGIQANVHYIPVHMQPYYRRLGFKEGDFPGAEHYYRTTVSLPLFSGLTDLEQDRVVAVLKGLSD